MSRNYAWGSRDMADAGRIALQSTSASFSTIATHIERFQQFKDFAKQNGVGRLERITPELVKEFGQKQAGRVEAGQLETSYAQNLISSINSVMKAVTRGEWRSVSPTKDCNIARRNNVRNTPTPDREKVQNTINEMAGQGNERAAVIAQLAIDLGLRSKEASLLNAKAALDQAQNKGEVSISNGTKGGRERTIKITNERQIETLKMAAKTQGKHRSLVPSDQTWKEFRSGELREGREALQGGAGARGYHDLRATYASERYQAIVGHSAPCNGGKIENRDADKEARQTIATELGHGRISVVSSYIGGR